MNREWQMQWENVYGTKQDNEVGWTQQKPQSSLNLIHSLDLPKTAKIIDVGGGDSKLVDHLLDEGFEDLTVLDISSKAIDKARRRLGDKSEKIKWIVNDVLDLEPEVTYQLWHDRATFHFLTTVEEIQKYISITEQSVAGFIILATFSDKGPEKCSGFSVHRYNEAELTRQFSNNFKKIRCFTEDHPTPFGTFQNFLFCSFKRTAATTKG